MFLGCSQFRATQLCLPLEYVLMRKSMPVLISPRIALVLLLIMALSVLIYPSSSTSSSCSLVRVAKAGSKLKGCPLKVRAMSENQVQSSVIEKMGIRIERNPSESRLSALQVRSWPKWGCPPSKFPWTYTAMETCYLLEGKVKVYPDGYNDFVEFGPKDLVVFPKGMKCTWDVAEAVDKHYTFE